ncbi:MAG: glycosyltransferase family 87 protein [Acidobacteriota bacterium]
MPAELRIGPNQHGTRPRSFWRLNTSETVILAWVPAALIWGLSIFNFSSSNDASLGAPSGRDFVRLYVLGRVVADRHGDALYDLEAFNAIKLALFPALTADPYPQPYPPHVGLYFAPMARLPYPHALVSWIVGSVLLFGAASWWAARLTGLPGAQSAALLGLALAFPPLVEVKSFGQATAIPLASFVLGWRFLLNDRSVLAGAAFGLLAVKPQLAVPLGVVAIAQGRWRMVAGAALSVAAQAAVTWWWLGPSVFVHYLSYVRQFPTFVDSFQRDLTQTHSLRSLFALLVPAGPASAAYFATAGIVLWQTVRACRAARDVGLAMSVLIMASVLVSPHLYIYDAAVMLPALVYLLASGWGSTESSARKTVVGALLLYPAYFLPVARYTRVQVSVIVLLWVFWTVCSEIASDDDGDARAEG